MFAGSARFQSESCRPRTTYPSVPPPRRSLFLLFFPSAESRCSLLARRCCPVARQPLSSSSTQRRGIPAGRRSRGDWGGGCCRGYDPERRHRFIPGLDIADLVSVRRRCRHHHHHRSRRRRGPQMFPNKDLTGQHPSPYDDRAPSTGSYPPSAPGYSSRPEYQVGALSSRQVSICSLTASSLVGRLRSENGQYDGTHGHLGPSVGHVSTPSSRRLSRSSSGWLSATSTTCNIQPAGSPSANGDCVSILSETEG